MSKEKKLWLKRLKLWASMSSTTDAVEFIKYSSPSFFKKHLKTIKLTSDEALGELIKEENKEKFSIFAKEQKQVYHQSFWDFVIQNGSKEQILEAVENNPYASSITYLIDKYDDEFMEKFFKVYNGKFSGFTVEKLVEVGFTNSLYEAIKKLATFKDFDFRNSAEKAIFDSNFDKLKKLYLCSVNNFGWIAKEYLILSKDKKAIWDFFSKSTPSVNELKLIVKSGDEELETFAVQKYLDLSYCNKEFVFELLKTKNDEALKLYISKNLLSDEQELLMVTNFSDNTIKFYIDKYGDDHQISDKALSFINKNKDLSLKEFSFKVYGYPYKEEKDFIIKASCQDVLKYIDNINLFSANEPLLFKPELREALKKYLILYGLSKGAEITLIKKGSTKLVKLYLEYLEKQGSDKKKLLCEEALHFFVKNGEVDIVAKYLTDNKIKLSCNSEKEILLRGNETLINLIPKISQDALVAVAKVGTFEQLTRLFFIDNVVFEENAEIELVKRKMLISSSDGLSYKNSAIRCYIEQRPLTEKAEQMLFEDEYFDEELIRYYIYRYNFKKKTELLLLNKKYSKLLELYIEKYRISDELFVEAAKIL